MPIIKRRAEAEAQTPASGSCTGLASISASILASAPGLSRDRRIHLYYGQRLDRLLARPLAAQREVGDIDAVLTQNRPDTPDHARHIQVAADQQIAFERRLDVDASNSNSLGCSP